MLLLLLACAGAPSGDAGPDEADDTGVPVPAGSFEDAAGALTGSGARSYVGSTLAATATGADGGPGLYVGHALAATLTPRPEASGELWTATTATVPVVPVQGLGDLDGDGTEDLFVATSGGYDEDGYDHVVRLWRGPFAGSVGWDDAAVALDGWTRDARPATTGAVSPDIDGDGLADGLYADAWGPGTVEVRALAPDAAGAEEGVARIVGLDASATWYVTAVGDADGDGLADLVVSGEAGGLLFLGPVAADTPAAAADGTGVDALGGRAADLDGDGRAELLARTTDGAARVLTLDVGAVSVADRTRATLVDEAGDAPRLDATSVADLDGDGIAEVALGVAWGASPTGGGAYLLRAPFTGAIALDRVERWYGPDGVGTFGVSVALVAEGDAGRIYVGASDDDTGGPDAGAVYWFEVE